MDINNNFIAFFLIMGLFLSMLAMLTLGHRLGRRSLAQQPDATRVRLAPAVGTDNGNQKKSRMEKNTESVFFSFCAPAGASISNRGGGVALRASNVVIGLSLGSGMGNTVRSSVSAASAEIAPTAIAADNPISKIV
jgi:hypothetical protein